MLIHTISKMNVFQCLDELKNTNYLECVSKIENEKGAFDICKAIIQFICFSFIQSEKEKVKKNIIISIIFFFLKKNQ